ncbi:MAG: ABC transporter permease [Cellulophaga sp.]
MHKLLLIIKREYLAKVRNKSFIIMTFLSPLLMVGMVLLIAYLVSLNESETRVITILNESQFFENDFKSTKGVSYLNFKNISLSAAKDSTASLGYYGLLYIPKEKSLKTVSKASYFYSKDGPNAEVIGTLEKAFQEKLLQEKLIDLGVSEQQFSEIGSRFEMHTESFSGEQNLKGITMIKAFIGGAFGYLIMMFIIIYGGFVMRSVIEEKTSRIIEVIISSVKPFQLMLGKILGTSLAGITQFAIWIVSASLLLLVVFLVFDVNVGMDYVDANMETMKNVSPLPASEEMIQLYITELLKINWGTLICFFIVYFMLGYLIYSSIYAAIGAAVDNETDTQQFILPIIMPLMLAIYVGFFSVFDNPHGPIAVGFSLFPLTSPIVMLMRLPSGIGEGGVPLWQVITSIVLLIVTFIGIVRLAAKIYRVGILMYGKKPSYKELYKWLKY